MSASPGWDLLPLVEWSPRGQPPSGTRWLVVHLPAFRLERCGWQVDELVVLVAERQNATRVAALTPAAREAGLREGMVVAEARALVPHVVVEPLDVPGEARDRAELCQAFERFGDRVEPCGDDAVLLEVSTTHGLAGGEQAMLTRVRELAEELGHQCRLAITDHPLAARALARYAPRPSAPGSPDPAAAPHPSAPHSPDPAAADVLVPVGEAARALAPLPIQALAPSEALHEALTVLGVHTLGAWARLDPASVAARYGAEGVELHRVARGGRGGPWLALPAPVPLEHLRIPLEDEVAQVDLLLGRLGEGLGRLRDQLAARDLVAARLELRLELAWGAAVRVGLRVTCPTRDPELLVRLLHSRLERLALEAPVTGILLHAAEVVPDGGGQQDLLDRRGQQGAWSELLARLGDVLGDDAVVDVIHTSGGRSEEAWRPEAGGIPRPMQGHAGGVAPASDDPVERQEGGTWHGRRPRPTLLRHPPLPLRVREDQGRPVAVRSREGWRPIARSRGPERLEGEWWSPDGGFARAYWVVALPEGTAWVFRERGQWFLHGWFD